MQSENRSFFLTNWLQLFQITFDFWAVSTFVCVCVKRLIEIYKLIEAYICFNKFILLPFNWIILTHIKNNIFNSVFVLKELLILFKAT